MPQLTHQNHQPSGLEKNGPCQAVEPAGPGHERHWRPKGGVTLSLEKSLKSFRGRRGRSALFQKGGTGGCVGGEVLQDRHSSRAEITSEVQDEPPWIKVKVSTGSQLPSSVFKACQQEFSPLWLHLSELPLRLPLLLLRTLVIPGAYLDSLGFSQGVGGTSICTLPTPWTFSLQKETYLFSLYRPLPSTARQGKPRSKFLLCDTSRWQCECSSKYFFLGNSIHLGSVALR
ncbi:unnamed protein product [Nyctereutes procyonoides]|uniref:(raccoon dog) hypothetical protein n=1 Tax=Nyctereutes procyonoides TaxID=34880 RepID=A0A811YVR8_NYCPR|nr:unnamed protein product [Nyctereutes procyonoides]